MERVAVSSLVSHQIPYLTGCVSWIARAGREGRFRGWPYGWALGAAYDGIVSGTSRAMMSALRSCSDECLVNLACAMFGDLRPSRRLKSCCR